MKRGLLIALLIVGLGITLAGCGPKMASEETLAQLNKVCGAADAAQQRIQQLQNQIEELQKQKFEKAKQLEALKAERDSLREWLDLLEKGY